MMRVMEIVRLIKDKPGQEVFGKVIAVRGRHSNSITVNWENGKVSDHDRKELLVVDSPFRDVANEEIY
jgi:hypothetical protein